MAETTISGDVAREMADLLGRFADRGKSLQLRQEIPGKPNSRGVYTLWSKKEPVVMLVFITPDDLRMDVEFDFRMLAEHGRAYIEGRVEDVRSNLLAAREQVAKDRAVTLFPTKVPSATAKAVNDAITIPGSNTRH